MAELDEVVETVEEPTEEVELTETAGELDETTAPDAEEATADADTTESDGRPRNADGTFAKKEAQEGPQAVPTAPDAPPPTTQTLAAEPKPFTFRTDKLEYSLDGAQYIEGEGVYIPETQLERTKQLLSQGVYLEKNWRRQEAEWERRIKEAETKAQPELLEREQRAQAILAELDAVLSDPQALADFYENLTTQGPALKERARAKILEQKLAEIEKGRTSEQQRATEEQEQADKVEAFSETIAALKADQRFKVFTDSDWQEYEQEMADLESVLFQRLEDGPEGPGLYIDTTKMLKAAERRASLLSRVTQQQASVTKAQTFNQLRARNAKTTTPTAQIPQSPVVREPVETKRPASREEWLKGLGIAV